MAKKKAKRVHDAESLYDLVEPLALAMPDAEQIKFVHAVVNRGQIKNQIGGVLGSMAFHLFGQKAAILDTQEKLGKEEKRARKQRKLTNEDDIAIRGLYTPTDGAEGMSAPAIALRLNNHGRKVTTDDVRNSLRRTKPTG